MQHISYFIPIRDESAQDLHSMALMGNAEIVVAGQQDKILSVNMIRGIVTKKVRNVELYIKHMEASQ